MKSERLTPEQEKHFLDMYLPHEIAHLWWGNALPRWVAEGTAVFANFHFIQETQGPKRAMTFLDEEIYSGAQQWGGPPAPLAKDSGMSAYAKGGYLLVMLESYVGKPAVLDALKSFYQRHEKESSADPDALTRDLVETLQKASGPGLQAFLSDWVYSVKQFDPALVSLRQEKSGESFDIALQLKHLGEIQFPTPVRLTFEGGSRRDFVWKARESQEELHVGSTRPVVVAEIDPDHVLFDLKRFNNRAYPTSPAKAAPPQATSPIAGWKTYSTGEGLGGQDVRCLFVGRDRRLYAGCWALDLVMARQWALDWFDGTWNRFAPKSDPLPLVACMAQNANGSLWLGGQGRLKHVQPGRTSDLILKELRQGGRVGEPRLQSNPNANSEIPGSCVYSLLVDSRENLWVGTDNGMSFLDSGGAKWRHFSRSEGLPGQEVLALAQDRDGVIWAGTDRGIARFAGERWTAYPKSPPDLILAIAVGPQGTVWFGTYRSGILALSNDTPRCYRSANCPLPHNMVSSLVCDQKGRLWAGTSDGLACFDGQSWKVFDRSNSGLPSNRIQCLAADDSGHLWIGTDAGVTRYDLQ